ncbi:MAG TPA: response regulator [Chloroflexota bacterium]|nr:response regulator [Chloroflexota bacterium]HUM71759.1 response regulator [Chloroflexota bacterium]
MSEAASTSTTRRILLADNDPVSLALHQEFLEQHGYEVVTAVNPLEAWSALVEQQVDLAIIDIRLQDDLDDKDTSGLRLARAFMNGHAAPRIIITSYATVDTVRDALQPNGNGVRPAVSFITKQEGLNQLLTAVQQAFQVDVRRLLEAVHEAFSDPELRELFIGEEFDYDGLSGSKRDKIVEVIAYYQRRGRLPELINLCRQARPYRAWDV